MKKIISLFFILSLAITAISQNFNIPVDEETNLITWQEVITEKGNKDELYVRAIEWINANYKNSQEVTRIRDKENGRIVINHRIRMNDIDANGNSVASNTIVNYILRLEFRENRFRYTFTEFTMRATSKYPLERWLNKTDPTYLPQYEKYLDQVAEEIEKLIESLVEGMKPKVVKEDVW